MTDSQSSMNPSTAEEPRRSCLQPSSSSLSCGKSLCGSPNVTRGEPTGPASRGERMSLGYLWILILRNCEVAVCSMDFESR